MEARKLAAQMAAICPFVMVIGMGYSARQPIPGHAVLSYSDAQNERIEAYRPIVADAPSVEANISVIGHHADLWIRFAQLHRLQALTPAFQEDLTEDNARSEVIGLWRWLGQRVKDDMRRRLASGEYPVAVEDGTRLIRLSEILKYSDFGTMHLASIASSRTVALIGPILGKVPLRTAADFNAAVTAVNQNRDKLPEMYKVLKSNYEDYIIRRIGFGRETGEDSATSVDDQGIELPLSPTAVQSNYIAAIRDEAKFRTNARAFLGLVFSPVKS